MDNMDRPENEVDSEGIALGWDGISPTVRLRALNYRGKELGLILRHLRRELGGERYDEVAYECEASKLDISYLRFMSLARELEEAADIMQERAQIARGDENG